MKTQKHLARALLCTTLPSSFLFSAQVFADDQAAVENQPLEIIITNGQQTKRPGLSFNQPNTAADRLGLTAMKIPGSIEVVSKEKIAIKGDYSSLSAVTRATGFVSSANAGNGGTSTAVRGFNGHGAVVYTYDGTRLYVGSGTVTFPADTWTIERIEVLRGPGSVINGVGAIGATVNYVPKAPRFGEVESELAVTLGSNDLLRTAYGSSGSINSQLAYRFDAVKHQTNGYVDRADETRDAFAASLLYQANDDLDIKFSVDYANIDAAPYWGTPLVNGQILDSTRRNNYNVSDGLVEYEDLWPRLDVNWRINEYATLSSTTFYMDVNRHWRNVESYDFNSGTGLVDRSFYLEILHDQMQLGNRTDVLFDFKLAEMDNKLDIGAEVNSIEFEHTNNRPYAGTDSVSLNNPVPGTFAQNSTSATSLDFRSDSFQYALFVDDHLQINDQFSVVAGLRRDFIDFDREDFARSNGETAGKISNDQSGTSWRLGVVYRANYSTSLYAQTSHAVDSIQSIISATNPSLKLGEGDQFEVGIKQSLWNKRVQYTLALFDITKNDLLSFDAGNVQHQIGQQSSRGIEFDLFVQATDTLGVDFNIALTDAEFDEFDNGTQNLKGNRPKNIPKHTANLWLNWQAANDWLVSGGARYVGERYSNDTNTVTLPDYLVYDAAIQWAVYDQVGLTLRGRNLTDEKDYVLSSYGNQWVLADGRSAEITLNYNF